MEADVQVEDAGTDDAVIRAELAKAEVTQERTIAENALKSIEKLAVVDQNLVSGRTGNSGLLSRAFPGYENESHPRQTPRCRILDCVWET